MLNLKRLLETPEVTGKAILEKVLKLLSPYEPGSHGTAKQGSIQAKVMYNKCVQIQI